MPAQGDDARQHRVAQLQDELDALRRKLAEAPRQARELENRLIEARADLAARSSHNERLAATLREAREQIVQLKEEIDRLAQPPAGFGVFLASYDDGSVDVFTGGRKLRVSVSPGVDTDALRRGQEVMLNEALNVVRALEFEKVGDVVMLKEVLEDGERALVIGHTDEERIVRIAEPLREAPMRAGDSLLMDSRSSYVYERIPKSEVEELILEEVPEIDYHDIGGLIRQIEQIRDAVELPYLHADLFREHELRHRRVSCSTARPGVARR